MKGDYSNLWVVGQPIDINYNLMTIGVWQLDEAEEAAKYGCKPGQYKVLDLDKNGKIDDADRVIDGKRTPDWTGGMVNTFNYKNFDLSVGTSFQLGGRMRNQFYVSYALQNNNMNLNNMVKDYLDPRESSHEMNRLNPVIWELIVAKQVRGEIRSRTFHIQCHHQISLK